jgi:K+/H+ antiporter YhaU regulatory subunit KhtT
MEAKINTEAAIIARIIMLADDHELTDCDIQDIIWKEFQEHRSTAYVGKVISDFMAQMYEDDDYDERIDAYTGEC